MIKKKKEGGKELSRKDFVKKMAYGAPAIEIVINPKYITSAQTTSCPSNCWHPCCTHEPRTNPAKPKNVVVSQEFTMPTLLGKLEWEL